MRDSPLKKSSEPIREIIPQVILINLFLQMVEYALYSENHDTTAIVVMSKNFLDS